MPAGQRTRAIQAALCSTTTRFLLAQAAAGSACRGHDGPVDAGGGGEVEAQVALDERGRLSLARFGFRSMQVVIDPTEDGGVVIHPAVALTAAEVAHYGDPEAVRFLEQALASAREGRLAPLRLRSEGAVGPEAG